MKTSISILLLFLSIGTSEAQTLYPNGVSGCIARWTFDTTDVTMLTDLPDMSGNGNNAILVNDVASDFGFRNKPFSSGKFNGVSSYAKIPNSSLLCPSKLSIISLVKVNGFNPSLCQTLQIISKGYPYFIDGNYGQGFSDNPFDFDCTLYNPNKTQLICQYGTSMLTTPIGNFIDLNKWYFVASVIDNNVITQYQAEMDTNAKLASILPINSIPISIPLNSNNQPLSIGKHLNPAYEYWYNGNLDEVILFNRPLSISEIYSIYSYLWDIGSTTGINKKEYTTTNISCFKNILFVNTELTKYDLDIIDLNGRILISKNELNGNNQINLDNLSSGIYTCILKEKNNCNYKYKFILNK